MESKVAIVTGASRGIGRAIALQLAKEGYTVAGTATTRAGAETITAYFSSQGVSGQGFCLDVRDQESVSAFVNNVSEHLGDASVLVNNAGITADNLFLRMKEDQWSAVIDTNLNSLYWMIKACLRSMIKARFGRIINIGSVVASMGNPGQANYCAAKAGMIGMTKSIAAEVASRGITANVVAPGYIETDMTQSLTDAQKESMLARVPANRMGSVNEVAAAVAFLASDKANYITGQTLHVNGGMHMS